MNPLRRFLNSLQAKETPVPSLEASPAPAQPQAIAPADPLDLQPLEPSFVDNPYPLLARLRETEPVHRNSSAVWVLTRHADILAALADPRFGNAPSTHAVVHARNRQRYLCADVASNIIPFLDPPQHDTPRRLIGRAFAQQIRHTPPDLHAIAEEFIAPLRDRAEFDLLHDFAPPLCGGRDRSHAGRPTAR